MEDNIDDDNIETNCIKEVVKPEENIQQETKKTNKELIVSEKQLTNDSSTLINNLNVTSTKNKSYNDTKTNIGTNDLSLNKEFGNKVTETPICVS